MGHAQGPDTLPLAVWLGHAVTLHATQAGTQPAPLPVAVAQCHADNTPAGQAWSPL